MKQSMTSGNSNTSKFKKWFWGSVSALVVGVILIIIEKLINIWWDSVP